MGFRTALLLGTFLIAACGNTGNAGNPDDSAADASVDASAGHNPGQNLPEPCDIPGCEHCFYFHCNCAKVAFDTCACGAGQCADEWFCELACEEFGGWNPGGGGGGADAGSSAPPDAGSGGCSNYSGPYCDGDWRVSCISGATVRERCRDGCDPRTNDCRKAWEECEPRWETDSRPCPAICNGSDVRHFDGYAYCTVYCGPNGACPAGHVCHENACWPTCTTCEDCPNPPTFEAYPWLRCTWECESGVCD